MAYKFPLVVVMCVLGAGCASKPSDDPVGEAFSKCIFDEAIKQGQVNRGASPDGVDGAGGACEAQGKAERAQMKARNPTYTDKQVEDIVTDERNAVWRYTINQLPE